MISSRLFKAFQPRTMQQALTASQTPFYNAPVRFFSKDESEAAAEEDAAEAATPEPEPVKEQPKPKAKAAPKKAAAAPESLNLDRSLFQAFSVGDIRKIDSTPDHKPPSEEDTIEGRYSGVLFTTASQNGHLYNVYEDLKFISELYRHSEQFRLFTENGGVGGTEIA